MFYQDQYAKGIHTSEAYMYALGGFEARLILRYPNDNHLKSVIDSPYFEKFQSFQYQRVNSELMAQLQHLQEIIKTEVDAYQWYIYDENCKEYPIHELQIRC